MKILRLFDSLKIVRTIFVAVACMFFIFPAKSDDCVTTKIFQGEQYTEENKTEKTIMNADGTFKSNTNYYVTDYIPLKAGDYRFTIQDNGTGSRPLRLFLYNENHDIIAKPVSEGTTSTVNLRTFDFNVPTDCYARISARNSTTEKSLQPINPITYTEPCIKIATTKYNETHFTPVETRLDAARTVINDLITQMQTNAVNVSKLAVEKQTRPNADCPAGKNCLLVTDPTGAENWYEIIGANAAQSSSNVPDYFSFTTIPLNAGDSVSFYLSPSGTFTVDWGDGSVPQVIERALEDSNEYSHSYANAGPKTIKITGRATGYSTRVLSFGNTSQIASIDGCLGAIFPTLGNGAGQQPKFSGTFAGTQITSIPENLFSGVTGAAERMFEQTFIGTQITSIPAGLFSGITDAAEYMFYNTFAGTQITSIPAGLFSDITGVAEYTFFQTFAGCSNLTGYIPESAFAGLISAGSPDTSDFMQYIFVNSTGLATACPQNMTEVSTPYKSTYWETRNGNYAVMCRPN